MTEWDFLAALAREAGCGILLDVNNIYVSARNHDFDALEYIAALPPDSVEEIHLAGHSTRMLEGRELLVDTHNARVCDDVWSLYAAAVVALRSRTDPDRMGHRSAGARRAGGRSTPRRSHRRRSPCSRCVTCNCASSRRSTRRNDSIVSAQLGDGTAVRGRASRRLSQQSPRGLHQDAGAGISRRRETGRTRVLPTDRPRLPVTASFSIRRSHARRRAVRGLPARALRRWRVRLAARHRGARMGTAVRRDRARLRTRCRSRRSSDIPPHRYEDLVFRAGTRDPARRIALSHRAHLAEQSAGRSAGDHRPRFRRRPRAGSPSRRRARVRAPVGR